MERAYRYKAFISYSHLESKWARWLHREIESFRTPKYLVGREAAAGPIPARLTPVFRDRDELASAANLSSHIRQALQASENLILICSPAGARSRWVNQEVEFFLELGRADRIFCLIVDGDPTAVGTDQDCFPPALRGELATGGDPPSPVVEPIAADCRRGADGRSLARLKIIAALLGVGLDDLRQRELHRKHRRMAVATGTSVAALAVMMLLAINAYLARNDANQRRAQAEDLLGWMVTELRESLLSTGRTDVLEQVGEKAADYFEGVNLDTLSDEQMLRLAEVQTQLGEIRMDQRHYDDALESFMQAYNLSAGLYRAGPEDGELLFARGQAEFWVGYVYWRRGDLDSARTWLLRYLDSSLALAELDPSRDDWAREAVYGEHNLAVLALESGDLDAAHEGFTRELDALTSMQAREASISLERDIADALSWLGNVALRNGRLFDALDYFERSAADLGSLSRKEPGDAQRRYDWAAAIQLIAEVSSMIGNLDRAEDLVGQAISEFDELLASNDENREWLRASLTSRISGAYLQAARGELQDAREQATGFTPVLEDLIAEESSDLAAQEQLADAYRLIAWIDYAAGDFASASEYCEKALRSMRLIEQTDRLTDARLGKLAAVYVDIGLIQASLDRPELATQSWQAAMDLLSDEASMARSPLVLDPWVRALTLLGRLEDAEALLAVLDASGYAPMRPWPVFQDSA